LERLWRRIKPHCFGFALNQVFIAGLLPTNELLVDTFHGQILPATDVGIGIFQEPASLVCKELEQRLGDLFLFRILVRVPLYLPVLEGLLPVCDRNTVLDHLLHFLNDAAFHRKCNLLLHACVQAWRNHTRCSTLRWRLTGCSLLGLLLLLLPLLVPGKVLRVELIPLLPLRSGCLFCSLHLPQCILVLLPLYTCCLLCSVCSIKTVPSTTARNRRLSRHLGWRLPGRLSGGLVVVVDMPFCSLASHPCAACLAYLWYLLLRLLLRLVQLLHFSFRCNYLASTRHIPSCFACLPVAVVSTVLGRDWVPVGDLVSRIPHIIAGKGPSLLYLWLWFGRLRRCL